MEYPKKIMRKKELIALGFPREWLQAVYETKGQSAAWKNDPTKPNSPMLFDTDELEKVRAREAKRQAAAAVRI